MKLLNIVLSLGVGAGMGYWAARLGAPKAVDSMQCYKNQNKGKSSAVFSFEGKTFYMKDLPLPIQIDLLRNSQLSFDQSSRSIEQTALRMLLAKEKGLDLASGNIPTFKEILGDDWIPDSKVKEFYEANKHSFPAGSTYDSMAPQIRSHLTELEIQSLTTSKLSEIKSSGKLINLLPAPCGPKIELDVTDQPVISSKANTSSTLTLVSDLSCEQCRQSYLALMQHLEKISEYAHIVHIAYSEKEEGLGFELAKGSICAAKQGADKTPVWIKASYLAGFKFTPGGPEAKDILEEVIANTRLDRPAFDQCLAAPETTQLIQKNNAFAKLNRISKEMAMFLNQRFVVVSSTDKIVDLAKFAK